MDPFVLIVGGAFWVGFAIWTWRKSGEPSGGERERRISHDSAGLDGSG